MRKFYWKEISTRRKADKLPSCPSPFARLRKFLPASWIVAGLRLAGIGNPFPPEKWQAPWPSLAIGGRPLGLKFIALACSLSGLGCATEHVPTRTRVPLSIEDEPTKEVHSLEKCCIPILARARDAGNEKWNDPVLTIPCGFLWREYLGTFPHALRSSKNFEARTRDISYGHWLDNFGLDHKNFAASLEVGHIELWGECSLLWQGVQIVQIQEMQLRQSCAVFFRCVGNPK